MAHREGPQGAIAAVLVTCGTVALAGLAICESVAMLGASNRIAINDAFGLAKSRR